jgi:hypothetical protein
LLIAFAAREHASIQRVVQELSDGYASLKQEYSKSTEMLLESMNSGKAKDTQIAKLALVDREARAQIEKLTLANERLQGLCRALRANSCTTIATEDPSNACHSQGGEQVHASADESAAAHACKTRTVTDAAHLAAGKESASFVGSQPSAHDTRSHVETSGAIDTPICIVDSSLSHTPGASETGAPADHLSAVFNKPDTRHEGCMHPRVEVGKAGNCTEEVKAGTGEFASVSSDAVACSEPCAPSFDA